MPCRNSCSSDARVKRRTFLSMCSAIGAASLPAMANAQPGAVNLLRQINELELAADRANLPQSGFLTRSPVLTEPAAYRNIMPRLVALVGRDNGAAPAIIEDAGRLLSGVHAKEHTTPAFFLELRAGPSPSFASRQKIYETLFASMKNAPEREGLIAWHVSVIERNRSRYETVGNSLGVPWYFIGPLHALEASFNFKAHLHNGDYPLTERTKQVPANRPKAWAPPIDWEASAKDALTLMGFANLNDWSIPRMLYNFERFNGFGYISRGINTPYLWNYSNHYQRGKFTRDRVYDSKARSAQCGAAVLIRALYDRKLLPSR